MRYIVINECDNEFFTSEHSTKEEAIKEADYQFEVMTDTDKKRSNAFYVLESINPDEEADNHLDGNIIKSYI